MPTAERAKEASALLEAPAESGLREDHFPKPFGGIAKSVELRGELGLKSWQPADGPRDLESARSQCPTRSGLTGPHTSCEAGAAGTLFACQGRNGGVPAPDVPGARAELG